MTEEEAKALIETLTDKEKIILLYWLLTRREKQGVSAFPKA